MLSKFVSVKDLAQMLQVDESTSLELMSSGAVPSFEVAGQLRTTEAAVSAWAESKINQSIKNQDSATPLPVDLSAPQEASTKSIGLPPLPTLDYIKGVAWKQVAPVKYTSRNGQEIDWQENAYTHVFTIGNKKVPITIAVFCDKTRTYKGVPYPYWGAEVYQGEVGHGLQAISEWVKCDDFDETRRLASLIKNGRIVVKPTQSVVSELNQLELDVYTDVITRANMKRGRCVIAHEGDKASMALHALVRLRQNGKI